MPAERTHKFKLDLRAQDARALLKLVETYGYNEPRAEDAARFERMRSRLLDGLRWLAKRYGVPFDEFLVGDNEPDTDDDALYLDDAEVRDASA